MKFRTAQNTHLGLRRPENEDSLSVRGDGPLWAVADGMGGHSHGSFASRTVVEAIDALNLSGDIRGDTARVEAAIAAANTAIYDHATALGVTSGTTIAALYLAGRQGVCFWVGDSRIYRLRDRALRQLTRDHTQVRHLVETRQITEAEARNHPMGHVLTRAVGVDPLLRIERTPVDILPGDIFLLCSDGLTACAEDREIAATLLELEGPQACSELVSLCLDRGAPDNVTLVVITCDEIAVAV